MRRQLLSLSLIYSSILFAQEPADAPREVPAKCFPAGTSLVMAGLSTNGKYVSFTEVNQIRKIFEIETGKLVLKTMDDYQAINLYMYQLDSSDVTNYYLRSSYTNFDTLKVSDLSEHEVTRVVLSPGDHYAFNSANGMLVINNSKTCYTIMPDGTRKKFKERVPVWSDNDRYFFHKDGRYLLLEGGHFLDVVSMKTRYNSFHASTRDNANYILFNPDGQSFSISDTARGRVTYDLATGKELSATGIPADLPRIQGFALLPLLNGTDYIYWLKFDNKFAVAGLAYLVKDSVAMSFCDPDWVQEQVDNIVGLLKEWKVREDEKERQAREADLAYEKRKLEWANYRASHPQQASTQTKEPEYTSSVVKQVCGYCKGTGQITVEYLTPGPGRNSQTVYTVDVYGERHYQTTNYGYGTKKCTACNGKGKVDVTVRRLKEGD